MKINVHGGHSLKCRGAKSYLDEVNEDRKIKNEVIRLLKLEGHTVYDCTDDIGKTQSTNLSNIVKKSNAHKVDLDVSIHLNACDKEKGDGKVKGTETCIYNSSSKAKQYATRVQSKMKALGFTNRGLKIRNNLYVLKHSNSPAMLIEVCFVDDYDDYILYQNTGYKMIAKAIAEGILNKSISTKKQIFTPNAFKNYKVKITTNVLNIRKEANTNSKIVGTVKKNSVYTIVQEKKGWGKLKSGAGWIKLSYTKKV